MISYINNSKESAQIIRIKSCNTDKAQRVTQTNSVLDKIQLKLTIYSHLKLVKIAERLKYISICLIRKFLVPRNRL